MKNIFYAILILYSSISFAHLDSRCLVENVMLVGKTIQVGKHCKLEKELVLAKGQFQYPYLGETTYSVNYWEGSYERSLRTTFHYLKIITNVCARKEVLRQNFTKVEADEVVFNLENPNLDRNVQHSYNLAALTQNEAKQKFDQLKEQCENAAFDD